MSCSEYLSSMVNLNKTFVTTGFQGLMQELQEHRMEFTRECQGRANMIQLKLRTGSDKSPPNRALSVEVRVLPN